MKKFLKISACFLAITLAISSVSFAQGLFTADGVSFKNGLIFVSGTTQSANMSIAVSAIKDGGDKKDYLSLFYVDEILSGNDAKYELSFNLKDAPQGQTLTGNYVLYLKCGKESLEIPFKYSDYAAVLKLITESQSADEIYNILQNSNERENLSALGFDMNLYGRLDDKKKGELCNLFFNGGTGSGAKEVSEKFAKSLGTVLVTVKNEQDILSGLEILNPAAGDTYFNSITDDTYKSFVAQCIESDETEADFDKALAAFKRADALYKINTASAGKIFERIKENAEILQITNNSVYIRWTNLSESEAENAAVNLVNAIGRNKVKSTSALIGAMDTASTFESGSSSGGGSSGGSSKGSSAGGNYNLSGTNQIASAQEKFSDLSEAAWAKEAILNLLDKKIISGYEDGTFLPNNLIKREEFTKIIVTAFDIADEGKDVSFSDVNKDEWYYPFIKKAYGAKIIKGISSESFGISSCVTRQDIAVMLSRVLEKYENNLAFTKTYTGFADESEISEYALNGIKKLYCLGVISGYEDGTVKPLENATRAEAAYIINSILKIIK